MSARADAWVRPVPAIRHDAATRAGPALVVGAALFNLILCYLNTRGVLTVSSGQVILVELGILAAGLYAVRRFVGRTSLQIAVLLAVYLGGLKLINPALDLKIFHDLAIMYVFYVLGTRSTVAQGNRLLWIVMLIVLAVGAFELFDPIGFGEVFNVWSYYVNKGVIPQGTVDYAHSNLFISGNRGSDATRTFFASVFGSHRISSIFLEPDSLGNFAVIVLAWCLSTKTGSLRSRALLFAFSALCVVLADSRFAAICCVIMLAFRQTMLLRSRILVVLMPVAAMAALTGIGSLKPMPVPSIPFIINDNFPGRLLFSGRLLASWGWQQWLALSASPVYTADTGYAYIINNLGLPVAVLLLLGFALNGQRTPQAAWMKFLMSVYFAASLCIGASVFTIKTAALLWFLYGTTNALRTDRV
jgi:putative polymerase